MNLDNKRVEQSGIRSLGDMKRQGLVSGKVDPKKFVRGPIKMDCLERPWQRGDITGILAGAGSGKTSSVLYILKHILMNNPEGIVIFVSLEMTFSEISEKWDKATEDTPELADRLYIVGNYDDEGRSKNLSIADIKFELLNIKEVLNETVHAFVIDHLLEIDLNGGVDYNPVCKKIKDLSIELDSHCFLLSQTTKGKGAGDVPVPKDGCFGPSRS